ncbi:hypothetical protein JOC78_002037 [Bacillus ectoiniformans]|uniref:DUF3813 domain-containing protein n=1 Tax=Bacillus ectoiniformans TaxID=1494429 RepID=UPI00195B5125|nr:DUF3813 domain-containing protein [Bacillus ectoiniformans]MBM7649084.1 hypothetical protein [Bacillus ectoiniformans]
MGNRLFQEARNFVNQATASREQKDIDIAKNSLSSAYANSTLAEQKQLSELQEQLRQVDQTK